MRFWKASIAAVLLSLLAACAQPVPEEKASYVGEWKESTMYLLITQDGSVRYERIKGGVTTSVSGPLKGFSGDNFDVGIGPMSTTFVVTEAPHLDGDQWKMMVDGVELVKMN